MKSYEQHIWNLLTRVLSGEADPSEKKKFIQWVEEDPANRAFFDELEVRWNEEPDENAVYHRFLFDRESGASRLRYKLREEKEGKTPFQGISLRAPAGRKSTGWKVAASILLLIGLVSVWMGIHSWNPAVTHYKTSNMQQQIINLPDGSTVRMNKNSTLSFKKGFSSSTRTVTLTGEAFFQVKHNADRPFIIHAGNAVVRDIGTVFNIKQQKDGKIVVAMKEGRVALGAKNANSKDISTLVKNDIGILNKGKVSTIKQENIQNYLSWIQERLIFKNMRLDKVIRQLDNIYGIHSSVSDPSLATLKFTAYTNNTSLDEVLDMIALSLDIEYRKRGENIVWMKKGTQPQTQPTNINDTTVTKD